ncbi:MAG TPA: type II toxin-antitoxin system PemK/MazF family toxin [Acetomicrobium flavidum]|uniref:mRNA interferase n=1 Tax=Acetomicrobium flavidum TaxID=49896 RepID=A0ABY1JF86_9BACT|nr:type II toxin-antitoxin system PemK/MazF family toxin [Acetomicrobium flavidum]SIN77209.1 mRNA interferase MazF [Acetomicrobium flavidum]HOJ82886.1 type II toxin-antitoxin system PemK/MazF family toxin [Acetomicrobium flavidum]HOM31801.1 type II toxin-antitoxin system PemK/MazF family toxin [Acetomicrobium flavidum]HPP15037.1 type II toxin-antitoxin system PemK/MazF family toxin [Acetomicrobium flavidum]
MAEPSRGEIWLVDLNPVCGHEQAGRRPALVVSVDGFNHGPAGLVIVIPITTKDKGIPLHVGVFPPEGGLNEQSFIKCEDVRSVAKERLVRCLGRVEEGTLAEVEDRLRILLGL